MEFSFTVRPLRVGYRHQPVRHHRPATHTGGRSHRLSRTATLRDGYAIVLPGVEGRSFANSNLAQGIKNAGYPGAIEIDNWTTGSFFLFPIHLRNLERNRREAWRIAQKIITYQDRYPGRPVHLIGHSGGGGVALLVLEALPPERRVTSAFLLQAAVSPRYDLSRSLPTPLLERFRFLAIIPTPSLASPLQQ